MFPVIRPGRRYNCYEGLCIAGDWTVFHFSVDSVEGEIFYTYFYWPLFKTYSEKEHYRCIRFLDKPNTLSGDILRRLCGFPQSIMHQGRGGWNTDLDNCEIRGNEILPLKKPLPVPLYRDDGEDLTELLATLPVVESGSKDKHYVRPITCKRTLEYLLACQGGSFPGTPISPYIVPLLGKTPGGNLVFEDQDLSGWNERSWDFSWSCESEKKVILQVIAGLRALHSHGIVHRSLCLFNLGHSLVSGKYRVTIAKLMDDDNRLAPEVSGEHFLDPKWTEKTDIYDLGELITSITNRSVDVLTPYVERRAPAPWDAIVKACKRPVPEDRPSLDEIFAMAVAAECPLHVGKTSKENTSTEDAPKEGASKDKAPKEDVAMKDAPKEVTPKKKEDVAMEDAPKDNVSRGHLTLKMIYPDTDKGHVTVSNPTKATISRASSSRPRLAS